jgi:hypothetical protein
VICYWTGNHKSHPIVHVSVLGVRGQLLYRLVGQSTSTCYSDYACCKWGRLWASGFPNKTAVLTQSAWQWNDRMRHAQITVGLEAALLPGDATCRFTLRCVILSASRPCPFCYIVCIALEYICAMRCVREASRMGCTVLQTYETCASPVIVAQLYSHNVTSIPE